MSFTIHIGPNLRKSPYFDATVAAGVRSFSVYNHMLIPGNFGDPDGEYDRLIEGVALWDVGAERQVEIAGPDAGALVRYLTPRDLSGTPVGQGRYIPICRYDGTLINDPVLLKLAEDRYWISIADSDIALWAEAIGRERGYDARVSEPDVSPLAIQGPKAMAVAEALFGPWVRDLRYFGFRETDLDGIPLVLVRSGWSKQGGFELFLTDGSRGTELWNRVMDAGRPFGIGPGAPNDTERLESGLLSLGADCRYQDFPADAFEMGLGKMIDLDRADEFVGKDALRRIRETGPRRRRTGFHIDGPPLPGNAHPIPVLRGGETVGLLSEFAHSKRLARTIGTGLIAAALPDCTDGLTAEIDGALRALTLAPLPFIR